MSDARRKRRPKLGLYVKARDIQAVETVSRCELVRESTLHQRCFPTVKHQRKVQARLKRLCEGSYLGRRFLPPIHRNNVEFIDYPGQECKGPVYFLGEAGASLLGRTHTPRIAQVRLAYLRHRLDIVDLRACLELALEGMPDVLLSDWYNEHDKDEAGAFLLHDSVRVENPDNRRKRRLHVRPDACFILQGTETGRESAFFVEIDEGTESACKRWQEKVRAYCAYWEQGLFERKVERFSGEGFRVLTITRERFGKESEKRKQSLLKATYREGGRGQFWFATFDQIMPDNTVTGEHFLTGKVWQRARKEEMERKVELALCDHLFA